MGDHETHTMNGDPAEVASKLFLRLYIREQNYQRPQDELWSEVRAEMDEMRWAAEFVDVAIAAARAWWFDEASDGGAKP